MSDTKPTIKDTQMQFSASLINVLVSPPYTMQFSNQIHLCIFLYYRYAAIYKDCGQTKC